MGPYVGPGPDSEGAATLRLAGAALYGPAWQTALAEALEPLHPNQRKIDSAVVRGWVAGRRSVPNWVWPALEAIALQRREEVDKAMVEVARLRRDATHLY